MRLAAETSSVRKPEPTIALINVVFLMLVFFLIAGTLSPPLDRDVTLVKAADLQGREPPDALVIHADGTISYRGEPVEPADALSVAGETLEQGDTVVRLVPDRDLPAVRLVEIGNALRDAGASRVFIVAERNLE
ncbi:ExbD/TolR family protein [Oricola thermophila]|uniref:Biopolymer transporter ExbD n=1 Tax=Oricola thermophila TaxID=2742145 RepID=A0A6N1VHK9_9HYPH|nr:biopolymer transporter ExbD [Oricola thermophila]QKV20380.1 biopolymer transporter ExbD [Oricola thermophila]